MSSTNSAAAASADLATVKKCLKDVSPPKVAPRIFGRVLDNKQAQFYMKWTPMRRAGFLVTFVTAQVTYLAMRDYFFIKPQ
jgi:hypothetical protein